MSLLFYCKVLFYCNVLFYCKVNPLQKKLTIFKTSGTSKQKRNYFVEKYKSLSRIIKHNKCYNCIRRKNRFIASAKILEHKGSISPSSFNGQRHNYQSHIFSLIYQVGEFSFKGVKTWGQSKIPSYCFVFGVNQENQEAGGVQDSLV